MNPECALRRLDAACQLSVSTPSSPAAHAASNGAVGAYLAQTDASGTRRGRFEDPTHRLASAAAEHGAAIHASTCSGRTSEQSMQSDAMQRMQ